MGVTNPLPNQVACSGPAAFKEPPYDLCPSLLPTLLQLLATEGEDTKAVKLLGVLGALEPLQARVRVRVRVRARVRLRLRLRVRRTS